MVKLGRSKGNVSKDNQSMRNALSQAADGEVPQSGRFSVEGLQKLTSNKGDHNEVARHVISGGADPDALKSFMPASLTCLNSFLPSVLLNRGPEVKEALGDAPNVAQSVVMELGRMRSDAPDGLHTLAFAGGFMVVIGSVLNIFYGVIRLSPLHAFFSLMMFFFGIAILGLEQQRAVFSPSLRAKIDQYFMFLTLITGRGVFLMYVGSIQAAVNWRRSSLNVIIGLYVLFVGGLYIKTGYSVSGKLKQLTHSLQSPEVIKTAFKQVDIGNDGELKADELVELMKLLGSTMNTKEAEAAILMLDKNGNGTLSLEEFLLFMERGDDHMIF